MPIYFNYPGRRINQETDILVWPNSLKCRQSNIVLKYSWPFIGLKSIMANNSTSTDRAYNTRETRRRLTRSTLNNGLREAKTVRPLHITASKQLRWSGSKVPHWWVHQCPLSSTEASEVQQEKLSKLLSKLFTSMTVQHMQHLGGER